MTQAVPRRAVTLDELRRYRDQIQVAATRYGVRTVCVFGSVASGTATPDSDLGPTPRGRARPRIPRPDRLHPLAVEDLLAAFTQVATPAGLTPRLRDRVLTEAVPL